MSGVIIENKIGNVYIRDSMYRSGFNKRQNEREYIKMTRTWFKEGRGRQ